MPVGGGVLGSYPPQTMVMPANGHLDQGLWQADGFDNVNDYVFADTLFGFSSAVADGHDCSI